MAQFVDGARRAPASPSVATPLSASGVRGAITGVTRIGSRAGLLAAGVLALIVLAIVYGLSTSGNHRAAATPVNAVPQILATDTPTFDNIPGANPGVRAADPDPRFAPRPTARPAVRTAAQPAPLSAAGAAQSAPMLPDPAMQPALRRAADVPDISALPRQAVAHVQSPQAAAAEAATALRMEREAQAMQVAEAARHAAIMVGVTSSTAIANQMRNAQIAVATPAPAVVAQASPDPNADPTVASQRAKNEFLSLQKSTTANDYITTPRQASISPYEVQAGSIIPAILISGINSDLPGTMIGQVSQNVYDSKTGMSLLIPAGSKIVGRYDSQVTNGQRRVLVAWQRILFPDSSFVDIGGLAGADTAGYSGLTGKVDDHSGKLFRNAILFSLIGAGATLLQPRTALAALTPGGMIAAPSVGSQVAGQVGTQLAQTAQAATQQGLQQQPTIEVRPGYLFNIMVDRDLVLPAPYGK